MALSTRDTVMSLSLAWFMYSEAVPITATLTPFSWNTR